MEQLYAESSAKQKTTSKVILLKVVLIVGVIILFAIGFLSGISLLMMLPVAGTLALIWYWPRFQIEWEYVFCDGQLDFDMIIGGEKRKTKLRIELEDADVIAPVNSNRMDGYRHLTVKDYSSLRPDVEKYGIVVKMEGKQEKMMLVFEPNKKMKEMMKTKFPNKMELAE